MKKSKKWKQLFCVALSLMMIISMSMMTFAQSTTDPSATSKTCTITAPENDHTYQIYQIFTGDLAELDGKTVLSNIKWGINGKGTTGDPVDEKTINEFMGKSDNELRNVAMKYINSMTKPVATLRNSKDLANTASASFTGPAGYYLIKEGPSDLKDITDQNDAYTLHIVQMFGNITIEPKNSVPSFEKKVIDRNYSLDPDNAEAKSDWQDSADYNIGDYIKFKLEATVPEGFDQYDSYSFIFHDEAEAGFEFVFDNQRDYPFMLYIDEIDSKHKVRYFNNGQSDTLGLSLEKSTQDNKSTFDLTIRDLKKLDNATSQRKKITAGTKIIFIYYAKLTDNAVFGKYGNVNKACLKFSNNPYHYPQIGDGQTPWDSVIVFTYKLVVNKWANQADTGNELAGADFKLEKYFSGPYGWMDITNKEISSDKTTFTFKGLDDGKYRLTETKTPDGYNSIDPIEFTIYADHSITWDGTNREDVLTSLNGSTTTGTITFTSTRDNPGSETDKNSHLETNIINRDGSALPETGGIGTKLFYLLGSVFVIGAVVLLVTKKRMSAR